MSNRERFLCDEQALTFGASVKDGALRSTVAVCLFVDEDLDLDQLTQQVVRFLDLHPEAREVWFVCPDYRRVTLDQVLAAEDLTRRTRALALGRARGFLVSRRGEWSTVIDADGFVADDQIVGQVLGSGGRAIFIGTGSLLTAHAGYHFGKPSGQHSRYFLRAAGAVDKRLQAALVALALLPRLGEESLTRIWVDTAGVLPVAHALLELNREYSLAAACVGDESRDDISAHIRNSVGLVADSFSGYGGLEADFDRRFAENDLVLISSSTSGRLAQRVSAVAAGLRADRILTLYGLAAKGSDREWLLQVIFDLASGDDDQLREFESFEASSESPCPMCLENEPSIALEGDGFFPATGGVTSRDIVMADASERMTEFMRAVLGKRVLRVRHSDEAAEPRSRLLATRIGHLLDSSLNHATLFRDRVDEVARPLLDIAREGGSCMIVHAADEDSRDLAQYLALNHGESCEIWSVSDDGLDSIATRGLNHVLGVVGVMQSGRALLEISRRLRSLDSSTSTSYFAAVSHAASQHAQLQIDSTLRNRGTDPSTGRRMTSVVSTAWHCHRPLLDDDDDVWAEEGKFLNSLASGSDDERGGVIRQRLKQIAEHSDPTMPRRLFVPAGFGRDDEPFPGIQRYFVFWSQEWSDGGTEEEVYYTIQCVLHTNRRSGKAGQYAVLSEGGNRFVIEPHMFDRFNDPILQASILRAAEVGELDYSADSAMSRTMRSLNAYMVSRAGHPEAAAVNEFLLSLCLGLQPGTTRHLRLRQKDLRVLADMWSRDRAAEAAEPFTAALLAHLIDKS